MANELTYTPTHLGNLIEGMIYEKRITASRFAKMLGISTSGIYQLFKRQDIEVKLLREISEILAHDFFRYYLASPTATEEQLKSKLKNTQEEQEALKEQIGALQDENAYLKEINELLKGKV